ncbi:MAG: fluoride efflux transporter CrcB [Bacteroidales bacterium]|nr:fluoride efflux transporter CrcB [Bacteroidales bacterium]
MTGEFLALAAVASGGAAGAVSRYVLGRFASHWAAGAIEHFPWHTFGINVLGSFLLGLFAVWYKSHSQSHWWLLLGTGFCGGFTTFSTFSLETLALIERDRWGSAMFYAFGSVAVGLVAAWCAARNA